MERNINMQEISDGRLYGPNDMVRVASGDCAGCFSCCQGMGNSIILDPYDCFLLTTHLGITMQVLLQDSIELQVVEGIILPNIKLVGEQETCPFLNDEGRCSIHSFRPGFCRLFPLGRIYQENDFKYFLQIHECKKAEKTKIKISKWIGIQRQEEYRKFILRWHFFQKDMSQRLATMDEEAIKTVNLYLLNQFFLKPFDEKKDFYQQFEERMQEAEKL